MRKKAALSGNGLSLYQTAKISEWSNDKAYADGKINVIEKLNLFWERLKTVWEKEKMLAPFSSMFSKGFLNSVIKTQDCVVKGYLFDPCQNFEPWQNRSTCRRNFKSGSKDEICLCKGKNIAGGGGNETRGP